MKKRYILLILVLVVGVLAIYLQNKIDKEAEAVAIEEIHPDKLKDGSYTGEYSVGPVTVQSRTTIQDGKITEINILKHANGLGGKAETIVEDVIDKQSLSVDSIAGATVSSKVILKSIEQALKQAK